MRASRWDLWTLWQTIVLRQRGWLNFGKDCGTLGS
jgi:hypothetical protein